MVSQIKRWLINFIDLQLFLTCVSLPILIGWGIPISLFSLLGNLIFMPFLAIFLLVASLIFFCELLFIPQGPLIYILEKVGQCWLFLMQFGQRGWLFCCPLLPLYVLIPLFFAPFLIIYSRHISDQTTRIGFFLLIITGLYCTSQLWHYKQQNSFVINSGRGKWQGLCVDNKIVLIDAGATSTIKSPHSVIDYTLIPSLIKATGSLTIDHLIITKPSKCTFDAISYLLQKLTVKNIYLVSWEGNTSKQFYASFFTLKKIMGEVGCASIRIKNKIVTIAINDTNKIDIVPKAVSQNIKKNIIYKPLVIHHIIDNRINTIYDANK